MIDYSKLSQEASWISNEQYDEGAKAFYKGEKSVDNPYEEGSIQYREWEMGWYDAEGYESYLDGYGNDL
jgi:hypothetical protein